MPNTNGLVLAISQAQRRRDEAMRTLALGRKNVEAAMSQLEQLRSYAGDTDARWLATGGGGLSVELLKHHYQFSGRLEQAISMQDAVVTNLQRTSERLKAQLLLGERRLAALSSLLKTRQLEAQRREQRREQMDMDEMAAQLFSRTKHSLHQGDQNDH